MRRLFAALLAATLFPVGAPAAVLWDFHEVGGDVVGTLSGSANYQGSEILIGTRIRGIRASISPANGTIFAFDETAGEVLATQWEFVNGGSFGSFGSFGPGIGGNLGTYTGTPLALDFPHAFYVVPGTTSFSGVYTIEDETFASIGITPGTYVSQWGTTTITLQFTPAATIPLPASVWLLAAAFGGMGVIRLRRGA